MDPASTVEPAWRRELVATLAAVLLDTWAPTVRRKSTGAAVTPVLMVASVSIWATERRAVADPGSQAYVVK